VGGQRCARSQQRDGTRDRQPDRLQKQRQKQRLVAVLLEQVRNFVGLEGQN